MRQLSNKMARFQRMHGCGLFDHEILHADGASRGSGADAPSNTESFANLDGPPRLVVTRAGPSLPLHFVCGTMEVERSRLRTYSFFPLSSSSCSDGVLQPGPRGELLFCLPYQGHGANRGAEARVPSRAEGDVKSLFQICNSNLQKRMIYERFEPNTQVARLVKRNSPRTYLS